MHPRIQVLKLQQVLESPGGLVKTQIVVSHLRISDFTLLGWDLRYVFLTTAQVMLMLLVRGPHFEKHCFSLCWGMLCYRRDLQL